MIAAILASLLIAAAGWPIAALLDQRDDAPLALRVGESYLLGAGVSAAVLLLMSLFHVAWSRTAFVVVLAIVTASATFVARESLRVAWPRQWGLANVVDGLTVIVVAGYARYATIAPPPENDFIAIWGLKAKEFWFARGIDWRFLENPFNALAHVDYPLLVPLLFDVHALVAGTWTDRWLGVVNIGFGVATLLVIRSFLAEQIRSEWLRALATLAIASSALSPWIGLAECAIVAYGTTAMLFLRRACGPDTPVCAAQTGVSVPHDALRGAIYLGLAASSKNEGLALIAAATIALLVARSRLVTRLWPSVVIAGPWLVLRLLHHLQTDITAGPVGARAAERLAALASIFTEILKYSLGKPLFWSGIIVALLLGMRYLARERLLSVAIVVQLLFFLTAYVVTPHDVAWHVRWSWERLVTQLSAMISFLAIIVITPLLDRSSAAAIQREAPSGGVE